MSSSIIRGDVNYTGTQTFLGPVNLPANTIKNAQVSTADPIDVDKYISQPLGKYFKVGTVATETAGIHVALFDGTIENVSAFLIGANVGAATYTIDVLKNGTTILSAAISFDNGDAARAVLTGTISVSTYVAGDVFEVVATATAGGGTLGTGAYVAVKFNEDPA